MSTATLRRLVAEHFRARRTGNQPAYNPAGTRRGAPPAGDDQLIADLTAAGVPIGGDYPRDDATRALVAAALAVAAILEREDRAGVVEQALMKAAERWKSAHPPAKAYQRRRP
jgi:hypothetical protein